MSTVHPADLQLTSADSETVVSQDVQPSPPYSSPSESLSSAQRLYASAVNDDTSLSSSSPQPNLREESTQGASATSPPSSATSAPYPSPPSDLPTRASSNPSVASRSETNLPYLANPELSNSMPGDRERVTDASQFYNERLVPQKSASGTQSHPRSQTVSEYSPSTLPPGGLLRAPPTGMNVSDGPQGNGGTAPLQGYPQTPNPPATSALPGQTVQQIPYVQPSSAPAVQYPSSQSPSTAQAQGVANPSPMTQPSPPSGIASSPPPTGYMPAHANFSPHPMSYSSSPAMSYSSTPTSYSSSPPTSYSSSPPTSYSSPPAPYPSPPANVVPAPTGHGPSPMGYPTSYPFPAQPGSYPVPTAYAPQPTYPMQPHQTARAATMGTAPKKTDVGANVALEIGKSMAGMFGKSVLKAAVNPNGNIVENVTDLAMNINPNSGGNNPVVGTGNVLPNVDGLLNAIPTLGTGMQPDFNAQYQNLFSQYQQLQANQNPNPGHTQNMQMLLHQMQQLQMAHQQQQQMHYGQPHPQFHHQAVHHQQQVAVGYHQSGSAVVAPSSAEIQAAVGKAAKYMKGLGKVAKFASTGRI
jgi:hypothetical protein